MRMNFLRKRADLVKLMKFVEKNMGHNVYGKLSQEEKTAFNELRSVVSYLRERAWFR